MERSASGPSLTIGNIRAVRGNAAPLSVGADEDIGEAAPAAEFLAVPFAFGTVHADHHRGLAKDTHIQVFHADRAKLELPLLERGEDLVGGHHASLAQDHL